MNNENTISQTKSNHSKTTLFLGIFLVLLIIGGVVFIIIRARRAPAGPSAPAVTPNPVTPKPPKPPITPKPAPKPAPIITENGVKLEDGKYYQFIGIEKNGAPGSYTSYLAHDMSTSNWGVHSCLENRLDKTTGTCRGGGILALAPTYNTIWKVKICPNNQFSLTAINAPTGEILTCATGAYGCYLKAPDPNCTPNTVGIGTQLFTIAKSQATDAQNKLACAITAVFSDDFSHQDQIAIYGSNEIKLQPQSQCLNCSFMVEQWTGREPSLHSREE